MCLSRLRNKDFIRSSYERSEGDSAGVDLPMTCEVIALIGVRGLNGFGVVVDIELSVVANAGPFATVTTVT